MTAGDPADGGAPGSDWAVAAETALATRTGLPPAATWLRDLFAAAPWADHPNYAGLASFWQRVHRGIRDEASDLRALLERARDHDHDPAVFERAFTGRLRQYLGHLQFHQF